MLRLGGVRKILCPLIHFVHVMGRLICLGVSFLTALLLKVLFTERQMCIFH